MTPYWSEGMYVEPTSDQPGDEKWFKRAFMQVKTYMRLSSLTCFEGLHPIGSE